MTFNVHQCYLIAVLLLFVYVPCQGRFSSWGVSFDQVIIISTGSTHSQALGRWPRTTVHGVC